VPKTDETLKARARAMRSNQTPAERKLWHILRAHRFNDIKFARQVVIEPYIVDFAARMHKLLIEIDGDTHGRQVEYDAARTQFLEQRGYRLIRFTNAEVMGNPDGVAQAIAGALVSRSAPLPDPLPIGEREL
jgi:very-short-patch-repair endonuclease